MNFLTSSYLLTHRLDRPQAWILSFSQTFSLH